MPVRKPKPKQADPHSVLHSLGWVKKPTDSARRGGGVRWGNLMKATRKGSDRPNTRGSQGSRRSQGSTGSRLSRQSRQRSLWAPSSSAL